MSSNSEPMELQYVCPNKKCSQLVLAGTKKVLQINDTLKCPHCNKGGVIVDIVYRLNVVNMSND